jgi:Periplasmic copper-binding protein (NosD)
MRAMSRGKKVGLVAAGALLVALIPGTPAMANPPCGSTVIANLTLTGDLVCAGNALTIGANAITIDLAGFKIVGNGTGTAITDTGQGSLTVKNGTISGFAVGLGLNNVAGTAVSAMTIRDGTGISAKTLSNLKVSSTEFRSTKLMISLNSPSAGFTSTLFRSSTLSFAESNNTQIVNSDLLDSTVAGSESNTVLVSNNVFVRSSLSYTATSKNWTIQSNTFTKATIGLTVGSASPGAKITGNTFTANNLGIFINNNNLSELDGTSISSNSFNHNGAAGILFNGTTFSGAPAVSISGNQFFHNGFSPAGRTDRLGRTVNDGLHTATAAGSNITISRNVTFVNANHGISSDPGTVVDGGGNESIADPAGCTGVVCA